MKTRKLTKKQKHLLEQMTYFLANGPKTTSELRRLRGDCWEYTGCLSKRLHRLAERGLLKVERSENTRSRFNITETWSLPTS